MAHDDQSPAGPPVVSIDPRDPFAGVHLVAALGWPQSESNRNGALATFWADIQARIDTDGDQRAEAAVAAALQAAADAHGCTLADILSLPGAREFEAEARRDLVESVTKGAMEALLRPAGGMRAVADAPGLDAINEQARQAQRSGAIAGQALCLIASIAHVHPDIPASMSRTWAVMRAGPLPRELLVGRPKLLGDHAGLIRFWQEWCGIAPLHAAVQLWFMDSRLAPNPRAEMEAMLSTPQGVGTVLGWAKWFRAWGTSFRPDRARLGTTLIPPETAHLYDSKGAGVPELQPPLRYLSDAQLAAARQYKARDNNLD